MAIFEHALFMLLLLVGIFHARLSNLRRTLALIAGGILLALLPPFFILPIPWELVLGLILPLLFWQTARRWLRARWRVSAQEILLWLATALALGVILALSRYFAWASVIFFAVVATSVLWRALEIETETSYLSQIGPLALIFLLTEVAAVVETPGWVLGGMFSGAAVGVAVGLTAVWLLPRLAPRWRGWLALGQVYLAYGFATLIDVSAVAAALLSIAIFVETGLRRGWDENAELFPAPVNSWPVFALLLALFVVLGWQGHQAFSLLLLAEAVLGLVIGFMVAWIARRMEIGGFKRSLDLWPAAVRMGLFVFAVLLLWPRSLLVDPLPLAVALALALLMAGLAAALLPATLSLQE
ncbi:MAG TPA: hypothetical protein VLS48_00950 [Anaerolineales bacterium]|nr:hypothetical protein [Anaerolineales bacterium]